MRKRLSVVALALGLACLPVRAADPQNCQMADLVSEVRLLRQVIEKQLEAQRLLALQAQLDRLEEEAEEEQQRSSELNHVMNAAIDADKTAFLETLRRSTERLAVLQQRRNHMAGRVEQQVQNLRRTPAQPEPK